MALNSLPLIAGSASTLIFMVSSLPMLIKAKRTKDLASYSLAQLLLTNLGDLVYSVYVYSLPLGPIWALHSFYLVTSALMLAWYLRYTHRAGRAEGDVHPSPITSRAGPGPDAPRHGRPEMVAAHREPAS